MSTGVESVLINKPSIIVTSMGRTGTLFFKYLFDEILPTASVLHEPDVLNFRQYRGIHARTHALANQLSEVGFERLVIKKLLGMWSIISISDKRFTSKLTNESASRRLLSQRKKFVEGLCGNIYVESNVGYYGLIDILPQVYKKHRAVFLVRDGRTWIQSWMNWGNNFGGLYGKHGLSRLLTHKWPSAEDLQSDPYSKTWHRMTKFHRLCWAWTRMNSFAIKLVKQNESAKIYHFESIFTGEIENLVELVEFCGAVSPGMEYAETKLEKLRTHRNHVSGGKFPEWVNWTAEQKKQFQSTCGPLMEQLGYLT